jgi:hypothetical protein
MVAVRLPRAPRAVALAAALPLALAACGGGGRARPPSSPAAAAAAPASSTTAAAAIAADPFAAILDERASALLAAVARAHPDLAGAPRTAVMARVVWQTVARDPVARVEAMAFLLPDGRLRWGLLAAEHPAAALEVASGLAYPEGALAEGLRRPLTAGEGDCELPLIPLVDVATLPEVARTDTFRGGYGLADTCRIAAAAAGSAWVLTLDWFGVIVRPGADFVLASAPTTVAGATFAFAGEPALTPLPLGSATPIVDAAGAPRCPAADDCFAIGERAAATGERALAQAAYRRACGGGHGLSCIHLASMTADGGEAEGHRRRAFAAFTARCDRGVALDCAYLGIALETGQGAAKDEAAAVAAYRRACAGDDALGCFNLGGLEREGRGTRLDRAAAVGHYQRAGELGDAGGCEAVRALAP